MGLIEVRDEIREKKKRINELTATVNFLCMKLKQWRNHVVEMEKKRTFIMNL